MNTDDLPARWLLRDCHMLNLVRNLSGIWWQCSPRLLVDHWASLCTDGCASAMLYTKKKFWNFPRVTSTAKPGVHNTDPEEGPSGTQDSPLFDLKRKTPCANKCACQHHFSDGHLTDRHYRQRFHTTAVQSSWGRRWEIFFIPVLSQRLPWQGCTLTSTCWSSGAWKRQHKAVP